MFENKLRFKLASKGDWVRLGPANSLLMGVCLAADARALHVPCLKLTNERRGLGDVSQSLGRVFTWTPGWRSREVSLTEACSCDVIARHRAHASRSEPPDRWCERPGADLTHPYGWRPGRDRPRHDSWTDGLLPLGVTPTTSKHLSLSLSRSIFDISSLSSFVLFIYFSYFTTFIPFIKKSYYKIFV